MNITYTGRFYKGLTREMESPSYSTKITYEVGKTYNVEDFDTGPEECAAGLHVVTSLAQALKWGSLVVEVIVPESAQVVWGKDKVRVSEMKVVEVVSLSGADLRGADLSRANLSRADLRGADLRGADLMGAYLRGAYLSGADLMGAYLMGANLSGADLSRAYLSRAYLSGAYLRDAYGTPASGTPDGWKLNDNGYWEKA